MSETPRKSGRLAVCAVLLLCAGAASWIYTSETGRLPWDGLLNTPTRSESSAPAENTVPSAEPERAVQSAMKQTSLSLTTSASGFFPSVWYLILPLSYIFCDHIKFKRKQARFYLRYCILRK